MTTIDVGIGNRSTMYNAPNTKGSSMKLLLSLIIVLISVDVMAEPARIIGLDRIYFQRVISFEQTIRRTHYRVDSIYLPQLIDTSTLFLKPHLETKDYEGIQVQDFVVPGTKGGRQLILRQVATITEFRINPIWLALYDGTQRCDLWYFEAYGDSTDGKLLSNYQVVDVKSVGAGLVAIYLFGHMYRAGGAWWVEGKLAHFNLTENGLSYSYLENRFGFYQSYWREGEDQPLRVCTEDIEGDTLVKHDCESATSTLLESCGFVDPQSDEVGPMIWSEWEKVAYCIVSQSNTTLKRRSFTELSDCERPIDDTSNIALSNTGAIYKGFYWAVEMPAAGSLLAELKVEDVKRIGQLLSRNLASLSPHGWYPGIPDRTLVLSVPGIKIVYGGSMGDELGVCSIEGEILGFFRSSELVNLIDLAERRH
jgi:hypothetical protein